jgi:hypothetical protein
MFINYNGKNITLNIFGLENEIEENFKEESWCSIENLFNEDDDEELKSENQLEILRLNENENEEIINEK